MIEGRKKKEEREEKMKKMPQTAQTVMNRNPKGNCHVLSSTSGFFFPTRLSATNLSTNPLSPEVHWGLQLGLAVRGLREDLPGHDGLSQKGGGKNTALSPDPWTETRTGRSSQHRMPIHKGTPPPPASPAVTCSSHQDLTAHRKAEGQDHSWGS